MVALAGQDVHARVRCDSARCRLGRGPVSVMLAGIVVGRLLLPPLVLAAPIPVGLGEARAEAAGLMVTPSLMAVTSGNDNVRATPDPCPAPTLTVI